MTTSAALANDRANRCLIGLPKWIWATIIAPLGVAACIGAYSWLWSLQSATSAADAALKVHETKIDNHAAAMADIKSSIGEVKANTEKRFDRVDVKLDWIIENGKK